MSDLTTRRALACALIAAAVTASGCSLLPKEAEEPQIPLVAPVKAEKEVMAVHKGAIVDKVTLKGTFIPAQTSSLYFRQGGLIKAVNVAAGDTVQAGQVLVELESGELSYDLSAAEINLQKAELSLADTRNRVHSEADLKLKQLDVDLARVSLQRLQDRMAQSRLVAPFTGKVVMLAKQPGQTVANGEAVVGLADPSDLVLEAEVASADVPKVAVGQKVRLDFADLPGGGGEGTLVQLYDTKDRHLARVKLSNPPAQVKEGLVGKLAVILQEKQDVLLVPNAGLRQFAGRTYVVLQTPQGKREVDVVTGIVGDTETEVVKGLKDGDQVVGR